MTALDRTTFSASELAWMVPPGSRVLLETSGADDPVRRASRTFAIDLARSARASLILYDRSDALPSSDGAALRSSTPATGAPGGGQPLGVAELDVLGMHHLRDQLDEARARSVLAVAWLARRSSPSGIAEAVEGSGAGLVVLPAPAERPSSRKWLRRLTLNYYAWRIPAPVVTVDESGQARLVEPLSAGRNGPDGGGSTGDTSA